MKYKPGYIGITKNGHVYKVLKYENGVITIRFVKTGYIIDVNSAKLRGGCIKDRLEPTVCGVGYLGYVDIPERSKEYNLWRGIIQRCYNPKRKDYKRYGAIGVTVCERWKCFANFYEDIEKIDGFDRIKFENNEIELDKDLKQINIPSNNKVYSLDTCTFISVHENRGLIRRQPTEPIKIRSINGEKIIETFCPVEELADKIGVKTQYITRILRKEAKTHQGWSFEYIS